MIFRADGGADEELDDRAPRKERYLCRRRPTIGLHRFPSLEVAKAHLARAIRATWESSRGALSTGPVNGIPADLPGDLIVYTFNNL